jgi:DNA polymerase-3 subunit gamma/tau
MSVVLDRESIGYDETALWQLGRAADGSMRDALSLADQAISFGNNEVREESVKSMLGSIDHQGVYDLIDAVIAEDGAMLLEKIAALSEFAPDYVALLDNILAVLHRIAIAHAVPDALDNAQGDQELVLAATQQVSAQQVQLLYQIGLIGQRDMSLAPMPRIGFEMVLLRMMSFAPEGWDPESRTGRDSTSTSVNGASSSVLKAGSQSQGSRQTQSESQGESPAFKVSPVAGLRSAIGGDIAVSKSASPVLFTSAPATSLATSSGPLQSETTQHSPSFKVVSDNEKSDPVKMNHSEGLLVETLSTKIPKPESKYESSVAPLEPQQVQVLAPEFTPLNWVEILEALSLSGVAASLAANCQLHSADDQQCTLKLSENHASLWNKTYEFRIAEALGQLYGHEIKVSIEVGAPSVETPAQLTEREKQQSFKQAVADIQGDRYVQQLIENFNGKLDPDSIAPLGN